MVKLRNKKNKNSIVEVADYLASDYLGTHEWELAPTYVEKETAKTKPRKTAVTEEKDK